MWIKMATKKRPPNVTSLTGDRDIKEQQLMIVLKQVERRCQTVTHMTSNPERPVYRTRSKGTKKVYKLSVHDCAECNLRNVEAFEEEYQRLMNTSPLTCSHGGIIQRIYEAPESEDPRFPSLLIPALSVEGRRSRGATGGAARQGSTVSSLSSVTVEKLETLKLDLETALKELSDVHSQLGKAVTEVEEGQLVGYEEIYSMDARFNF